MAFKIKVITEAEAVKKFSFPFEHFAYVNIDTLQGTCHKQYN